MRYPLYNLLIAIPLLSGLGCSKPAQSSTPDAGPSYRESCEAQRSFALGRSLECSGIPPEAFAKMTGWDIHECPEAPPPHTSYDPAAAAECLKALETATCFSPLDVCYGVVRGASAIGEECLDQFHCAEGYCTAHIAPFPCPGRCEAKKAAGEACVAFDTAEGDRDNCEGRCSDGVCVDAGTPPAAEPTAEGDACSQDHGCGYGFICSRQDLICIPMQEGNPCEVQQDCYGLHEQPGDVSWPQGYVLDCDAATHKCFRVYLKQLGEPCSAGECQPYLYCSEQGVCTVWPVIGEPCDDYYPDPAGCLRGVCEQANAETMGVCVPAAGPGEPCNSDWDCDSTWCDDDTKTCMAQCMTW
jgi:hypothetical protein